MGVEVQLVSSNCAIRAKIRILKFGFGCQSILATVVQFY